ncbi:DUF1772 domain-containing protein [soil metagenome]
MTSSSPTVTALTATAVVGSAVGGGVFFAFSTFVMKALDDLPPADAIRAMQSINRAAPNPAFMGVLFGTGALCLVLGGSAVTRWDQPGSRYLLAGSVVYLAGLALTAGYHVPRNDSLALVDPARVDAARAWVGYARGWTPWNHVRTLTSVGAAVAFTLGYRAG